MKMRVEWHQDCLKNLCSHLGAKELELTKLSNEIGRLREDVAFREKQIYEAQAKGISEYDADKFLVKKGK